jgi:hypothetical protein
MTRHGLTALMAGAAALLWSAAADAQAQQRQPRGAAQRAQPAPAPAPVPLARVRSEPSPAACEILGGNGQSLSRVFGTPDAMPLANRGGGERVVCNKPGFSEARKPLAPVGETTNVVLSVDPHSRVVTIQTIQPGGGVRIRDVPTAERLVILRQRYLDQKVTERRYFAERRYLIWADSELPPEPRAATARPAPRPASTS